MCDYWSSLVLTAASWSRQYNNSQETCSQAGEASNSSSTDFSFGGEERGGICSILVPYSLGVTRPLSPLLPPTPNRETLHANPRASAQLQNFSLSLSILIFYSYYFNKLTHFLFTLSSFALPSLLQHFLKVISTKCLTESTKNQDTVP